jgi:hypothetical protein
MQRPAATATQQRMTGKGAGTNLHLEPTPCRHLRATSACHKCIHTPCHRSVLSVISHPCQTAAAGAMGAPLPRRWRPSAAARIQQLPARCSSRAGRWAMAAPCASRPWASLTGGTPAGHMQLCVMLYTDVRSWSAAVWDDRRSWCTWLCTFTDITSSAARLRSGRAGCACLLQMQFESCTT